MGNQSHEYVYEYEDSMRYCVMLLEDNFAKLFNYAKHQEIPASEFSQTNDEYKYMKSCLDTAKKNIMSLNSDYSRLNRRYSVLFENNAKEEFINYAQCQEPLRLKFIETIFTCKRVKKCLDDIQNGIPITMLNEDSIQNPLKSFRDAYNRLSSNVEFDSSSGSKKNTSPSKFDPHKSNNSYIKPDRKIKMGLHSNDDVIEPVIEEEISAESPISRAAVVTESYESSLPESKDNIFVEECDTTVDDFVLSKQNEISNLQQSNVCDICGRNFSSKKGLNKHKFQHNGLTPFGCTYCSKSFSRNCILNSHILSAHASSVSQFFECDLCGKRYLHQKYLDIHKRVHEGITYRAPTTLEYSKTCTVCGKSFNSRWKTIRHMLVHNSKTSKKSAKYGCTICGQKFTRDDHRKRHEQTVHADCLRYCCTHCGKRYQSSERFLVHLKTAHNL